MHANPKFMVRFECVLRTNVGVVVWYAMPGLFGADITTWSVVVVDDDGYGDASLKFIPDSFAFLQHETLWWLFLRFFVHFTFFVATMVWLYWIVCWTMLRTRIGNWKHDTPSDHWITSLSCGFVFFVTSLNWILPINEAGAGGMDD